jgi:hypothetical protein
MVRDDRINREIRASFWHGFVVAIIICLLLAAALLTLGCRSAAPAGPQAAAWCSAGEEEGYCDAGTSVPLAAWEAGPGRYAAPVVFVGAKTAGAGVALGAGETERYAWGVGAGVACPWSFEQGLQTDEAAAVLGVTVSLTRNREKED